jgi:protease-4
MDRDAVHEIAQGRVWTGAQAKERGLVDELGGLDVALAKAAEVGGLGEDYTVERWPKSKTFVELVLEDLEGAATPTLALPEVPFAGDPGFTELLILDRVLDDGSAALLPGDLRVRD